MPLDEKRFEISVVLEAGVFLLWQGQRAKTALKYWNKWKEKCIKRFKGKQYFDLYLADNGSAVNLPCWVKEYFLNEKGNIIKTLNKKLFEVKANSKTRESQSETIIETHYTKIYIE